MLLKFIIGWIAVAVVIAPLLGHLIHGQDDDKKLKRIREAGF